MAFCWQWFLARGALPWQRRCVFFARGGVLIGGASLAFCWRWFLARGALHCQRRWFFLCVVVCQLEALAWHFIGSGSWRGALCVRSVGAFPLRGVVCQLVALAWHFFFWQWFLARVVWRKVTGCQGSIAAVELSQECCSTNVSQGEIMRAVYSTVSKKPGAKIR